MFHDSTRNQQLQSWWLHNHGTKLINHVTCPDSWTPEWMFTAVRLLPESMARRPRTRPSWNPNRVPATEKNGGWLWSTSSTINYQHHFGWPALNHCFTEVEIGCRYKVIQNGRFQVGNMIERWSGSRWTWDDGSSNIVGMRKKQVPFDLGTIKNLHLPWLCEIYISLNRTSPLGQQMGLKWLCTGFRMSYSQRRIHYVYFQLSILFGMNYNSLRLKSPTMQF